MSNPWTYTYHRFASREAFEAAVAGWNVPTGKVEFDLVGTVYEPTGETILDPVTGEQLELRAPVDGYHVNVARRGDVELPQSFTAAAIEPSTPYRVWA